MALRRKPITSRSVTPERVDQFFAVLALTANVSRAAKAAKVSREWAYSSRAKDEAFAQRWKEAEAVACDALEEAARLRALKGVSSPVFHQGKLVGHVKKYSDTLMVTLLKAHRPEKYKDRQAVEHGGKIQHAVAHALSPRSEALLSMLLGQEPAHD